MDSAIVKPGATVLRRSAALSQAEYVAMTYFVYLAALGWLRHLPWQQKIWLAFPPLLILSLVRLEHATTRPWSRVLREYMAVVCILPAYWSVEWFAPELKRTDMQNLWVGWDRILLDGWGLRAAIDSLGVVIPFVLETAYMSLYAIPPVFLAILFLTGSRKRTRHFLYVLLLGTLAVYACLPFIPVDSPRNAFPGVDLPQYSSWPRILNTWLLDHMDISTSVFPSGHVAVAFSTALGLLTAVPERKWLYRTAFVLAFLVFAATIYGRYHYAVDGLTSAVITVVIWFLSRTWHTE